MTSALVIGVVAGSGGVGASALSAALAVRAAATGRTAVCVDGDRLGGGLDVTLGLEQEPGLRWPDLAGATGRVDGAELLRRLPVVDGVAVVSFDRTRPCTPTDEAVAQVVTALRASADLLVLDLPRPGCELSEPFSALADTLVLLAGDSVRGLAAASTVAATLSADHDQVWLCLRSGSRGADLIESVGAALDLPVLAEVRHDPGLDADLLHGIPPGSRARGPLARAADQVLAGLLLPGAGRRAS